MALFWRLECLVLTGGIDVCYLYILVTRISRKSPESKWSSTVSQWILHDEWICDGTARSITESTKQTVSTVSSLKDATIHRTSWQWGSSNCFLVFKHKIVDNWSEKCIALWTAITLGRKQTAGKRGAVMAPAYSTGAKKRRYPTFILLPLEAMWCSVFPTNVKGIFIQANPSAALSGVILWYKNRQRML